MFNAIRNFFFDFGIGILEFQKQRLERKIAKYNSK